MVRTDVATLREGHSLGLNEPHHSSSPSSLWKVRLCDSLLIVLISYCYCYYCCFHNDLLCSEHSRSANLCWWSVRKLHLLWHPPGEDVSVRMIWPFGAFVSWWLPQLCWETWRKWRKILFQLLPRVVPMHHQCSSSRASWVCRLVLMMVMMLLIVAALDFSHFDIPTHSG